MQAKTWWFGVSKLGKEAALKAIKEWGQLVSKITHLVFSTSTGVDMPGVDFQLTKLPGLNPNINSFMIYQQGYYAGRTCLRLAKDLAENNLDAQVLVVCAEITTMFFSYEAWVCFRIRVRVQDYVFEKVGCGCDD